MKRLMKAVVAGLALLAMHVPGSAVEAQGKIRVALWDFEYNGERRWWFVDDIGKAARNQIDTAFSENTLLSEKFSVIERERLDMVMKEQGLSAAGAIDPQTQAKIGKILGVRYIVTGGVDKFAINTTRGGIGGIGGSKTTAQATINIRFIDTTTAERVVALSADGEVSKGGAFIRGANLSREAEWGIASETIEKAAKALVEKLAVPTYIDKVSAAAAAGGGVDMRVIKVDGTRAFINVGATAGIKVGDKFRIIRRGEELVDPATGMKLGAEEKQVGTAVVTEVQERFSIVTITGAAAANDALRR